MQLFHGTRQRFDKFDVAYKGFEGQWNENVR